MGSVVINGKEYTYTGNNIAVNNNRVYVDGREILPDEEMLQNRREMILEVKGDLASLATDCSVTIHGNVQGSVDAGGSITCGSVGGNAEAGESITCKKVGGSIEAGGSVKATKIKGDVTAGGSVHLGR